MFSQKSKQKYKLLFSYMIGWDLVVIVMVSIFVLRSYIPHDFKDLYKNLRTYTVRWISTQIYRWVQTSVVYMEFQGIKITHFPPKIFSHTIYKLSHLYRSLDKNCSYKHFVRLYRQRQTKDLSFLNLLIRKWIFFRTLKRGKIR